MGNKIINAKVTQRCTYKTHTQIYLTSRVHKSLKIQN